MRLELWTKKKREEQKKSFFLEEIFSFSSTRLDNKSKKDLISSFDLKRKRQKEKKNSVKSRSLRKFLDRVTESSQSGMKSSILAAFGGLFLADKSVYVARLLFQETSKLSHVKVTSICKIARVSSENSLTSFYHWSSFYRSRWTKYTKRERTILVHNYHAMTNWLCNIYFI